MLKHGLITLCMISVMLLSCNKEEPQPSFVPGTPNEMGFSVDENYILKDGAPFNVKGVVYVPGYPGFLPWEIERSTNLPQKLRFSIDEDISNIKAMGANTIRLWGAPKYCYEVIKELGDLDILQTIWINGEEPDLQNPAFKESTKNYIEEIIDRIYSAYNNNDPPLIAFIIGNELSKSSIRSTNNKHPDINYYSGNYIETDSNITASEAFIAEMADHARTYEYENYGNKTLLTYSNEIRTRTEIDISFLDFISHNVYSYAVAYYMPNTIPGTTTSTLFQGWIEDLKSQHPEKPLLITETGLSVSPNAPHLGAPNYGYGGNTEMEQVNGLLQNLRDISTSNVPIAGVCIHEYLDAWWKFSLEDSYSQDPDDVEEWFGIVKLRKVGDWYETEFRESYNAIKEEWQ